MRFKKINNTTGWIVCIIACTVYALTREASGSFWDCGEFISSAYKMQVPHPPGAPLFVLLGRLFIVLFGGTPQTAALKVNLLSALAAGFTILFLFWTITFFARKLTVKDNEPISNEKMIAIMGAGIVGALAYTFSDSFWFSAVEGEVYALSSFFTALVFWAMLKWEAQADSPYADRWILFIAFMTGLSIGVHLLNLLTIPAIVMIYYFRKYKPSYKGVLLAFIVGCLLVGLIQVVVIQYTVKAAGAFDILFVNGLGLPFNSGTGFFLLLLAALIFAGIRWAKRKGRYFLHLGLLCLTFMLIGYSTYFTTVIRANADPAINMQHVSDPAALASYLDRDQYGDFPLLYGPDFTARPTRYEDGAKIYEKDRTEGKYVVVGHKPVPVYDPADEHLFPRIWDAGNDQGHADFYRRWLGLAEGERPSFGDNLNWFFSYQLGWMYARYFMWNFSGRQNDIQGFGNVRDSNWISGIPFIDNLMLGDQSKLPDSLKNNKAHNTLFALPFVLGLFGLMFQLNRSRRSFLVSFLLFFFTGIAIVLYLNQAGPQPRERDYSYVGSFYVFAIWIGLGVLSVYDLLKRKMTGNLSAGAASLLCLLAVPGIMSFQEWDDHDRSQKTLGRDAAADYLNSCAPDAILFTAADNDTYPLWYAQEVEGVRPDVRIIIMTLLGGDWYIDALRHKINKADAVPMSWAPDKYAGSNRNYVPYVASGNIPGDRYFNINDVMNFIGSDNPEYKIQAGDSEKISYLPTQHLFLPVNKAALVRNGSVSPSDTARIATEIPFTIPQKILFKNDLMMLNIIAANDWKRPVYFSSPLTARQAGLGDYLEMDGLTYRLVPVAAKDNSSLFSAGNVNTGMMYNNLLKKFTFGGAQKSGTYFDETNRAFLASIRESYAKLGIALAEKGQQDSALRALSYCDSRLLESNFPYGLTSPGNVHNLRSLETTYAYYLAGDVGKANEIAGSIRKDCLQQLDYYNALPAGKLSASLLQDRQTAQAIIAQLQDWKQRWEQAPGEAPSMRRLPGRPDPKAGR